MKLAPILMLGVAAWFLVSRTSDSTPAPAPAFESPGLLDGLNLALAESEASREAAREPLLGLFDAPAPGPVTFSTLFTTPPPAPAGPSFIERNLLAKAEADRAKAAADVAALALLAARPQRDPNEGR